MKVFYLVHFLFRDLDTDAGDGVCITELRPFLQEAEVQGTSVLAYFK